MIIDTSAVITILAGEPDAARYAQWIERDPTPRIGTPALLEASIVLTRWFGEIAETPLDSFVRESGSEIIGPAAVARRPGCLPPFRQGSASRRPELRRLHELRPGAGL